MCGIVGVIDLSGTPVDSRIFADLTARLTHRGPDGQVVKILETGDSGPAVVFGHRRLAVIDLSEAGAQPLSNEDATVVVLFNGEIYNFRELRRELEARGHVFRSRTDTEVIVHAYEVFGADFVRRLDGMFAFALWDRRNRSLLLARDRAGKKPLYYAWDGTRLTFASELSVLRACPWVRAAVDWNRLPELLTFGYVPGPNTMYCDIRQVPPATTLALTSRLSAPQPYWALKFDNGDRKAPSLADAKREVLTTFREAVERRLVSDVPLGVLLSGGLDSSAIVAVMSQLGS